MTEAHEPGHTDRDRIDEREDEIQEQVDSITQRVNEVLEKDEQAPGNPT